jgi:phage-related protein
MVHLNANEPGTHKPILSVKFYANSAGNEPVRAWLQELSRDDRKTLGEDIGTVQYGRPLGMPLVRRLEPGLWEVRARVANGIARVLFTVEERSMILLHGFVKKSRRTPAADLKTARERRADLARE